MNSLRVCFVMKVDGEIQLNDREVECIKKCKAEGKEILEIDALREELAEMLGIKLSDVEFLEHSETLIERKGE